MSVGASLGFHIDRCSMSVVASLGLHIDRCSMSVGASQGAVCLWGLPRASH